MAREVSQHLGNTPSVARASSIDPRVFARVQTGRLVAVAPGAQGESLEAAVLDLLADD